MTYLDYQATTPLAPEALKAMLPWLEQGHANPHSPHRAGRQARAAVEVARDQVAALLPTGGRVVFTSGATEALNWAIKGVSGGIVTTAIEHAARVRLRPILMTTAAMVAGLLPLLFASGAGAASRFALGLVVVAGMSIGTMFTLFVLPAAYLLMRRRQLQAIPHQSINSAGAHP